MNRRQNRKWLRLALAMGMFGANMSVANVTTYAQTDERGVEACPIIVDGQAIDTETTKYPTTPYKIIEANLPADRVSINESELFSKEFLIIEDGSKEETYYQNYAELETYRDYSIWPMYILTYDNGGLALLAPINMYNELDEFYTVTDYLTAQNEDLYHKLISDYMHAATDDLDQIYHLSKGFPTSVFADGKANYLRAEAIFNDLAADHPDYEEASRLMEEISFKYFILEGRYNNACGADLYYDYFIYDDVNDPDAASDVQKLVASSLEKMPLDLQERLFDIRVIRQDQLNERTKREDLMMKAYSERILYFSEEMGQDPSVVYHAVGQILDLSTHMPIDTTYEQYTSYSLSDEWIAVHEAEWLNEDEADALSNDPFQSFGQAFAAYSLAKYEGKQMSDFGHEGLDIADHPLSQTYFDDLFTRLDFN